MGALWKLGIVIDAYSDSVVNRPGRLRRNERRRTRNRCTLLSSRYTLPFTMSNRTTKGNENKEAM